MEADGCFGGFDTRERLARELANKANVTIVFVDYMMTLSPEAHYPIPIEEAYAATKWVAKMVVIPSMLMRRV